mmetsp:Transcript_25219/g.52075  ORF Transcript_25219/g.52075 Transcript_25219/m.52075 type:complete len:170 (+) Transcript_25219:78-587(+)
MRSKSKSSLFFLSKTVNIDNFTSVGLRQSVILETRPTGVASPFIFPRSKFSLSSFPVSEQPPHRFVRLHQWNRNIPRRQSVNHCLHSSKGHRRLHSFSKLTLVRSNEKLDSEQTSTPIDQKKGRRSLNSEAHCILNLRLGSISKENCEKAKKNYIHSLEVGKCVRRRTS